MSYLHLMINGNTIQTVLHTKSKIWLVARSKIYVEVCKVQFFSGSEAAVHISAQSPAFNAVDNLRTPVSKDLRRNFPNAQHENKNC